MNLTFFLAASVVLVCTRLCATIWVPWRLLSCSTLMLCGMLMFIVSGVAGVVYVPWVERFVIVVSMYACIVLGEVAAAKLQLGVSIVRPLEPYIAMPAVRRMLLVFGFLYIAATYFFQYKDELTGATDGLAVDVAQIVEERGQQAASDTGIISGIEGLVRAIVVQLRVLFYLGAGLALLRWRRLALLFFIVLAVADFSLNVYGARSTYVIAGTVVILLFLETSRSKVLSGIVVAVAVLGMIVVLNIGQHRRSGTYEVETLIGRIEKTFVADFSYGGMGLTCMENNADVQTAWRYVISHVAAPFPRFLWPDKPYINPNQEMTSLYTHGQFRSVLLFTPLGEALFYFGYSGIALIGFLYGFTAICLENVFRKYKILLYALVYLYVWTFLGFRHTYYNFFQSQVLPIIIPAALLFALSFWKARERASQVPVPPGARRSA